MIKKSHTPTDRAASLVLRPIHGFHISATGCCLLIVAVLSLLMGSGCSRKIAYTEILVKDGLVYHSGENKPFSGVVFGKGYPDGMPELCTFEKIYKKGLLHGTSKFWFDNGKLAASEPYELGNLNGPLIHYYRNGHRRMMIDFVDGLRGGNRGEIFWTKDGKIKPG